ncbi:Uncharacterised protein [uncultured archaeon]|nr:Uncharacterised protein [uncultured archaeon]
MSKELRRDRHTVSILSDHIMFAPKYSERILESDVAIVAEGIICKTCKGMGIETQDQYHAKNVMYRPRP